MWVSFLLTLYRSRVEGRRDRGMKNFQLYVLMVLTVIAAALVANLFKYNVAHLESSGQSFLMSNILGVQLCFTKIGGPKGLFCANVNDVRREE